MKSLVFLMAIVLLGLGAYQIGTYVQSFNFGLGVFDIGMSLLLGMVMMATGE